MKKDCVWYRWYTDHRDDLMLDMYLARFVEVRAWCEKNFATEEVYPHLFVVYPESPNAWMYNFKVCKRNSEKEEKLTCDHDKWL